MIRAEQTANPEVVAPPGFLRTKGGRRRQNDHVDVAVRHSVNRIKSGDSLTRFDLDPIRSTLIEAVETFLNVIIEEIPHGRKRDVIIRIKGIHHRACSPSTATDQSELERLRVWFLSRDKRGTGNSNTCRGSGSPNKFPPWKRRALF